MMTKKIGLDIGSTTAKIVMLDFDGGVSETNITNRMLLFIDRLR